VHGVEAHAEAAGEQARMASKSKSLRISAGVVGHRVDDLHGSLPPVHAEGSKSTSGVVGADAVWIGLRAA
jgi:hypothetical protein